MLSLLCFFSLLNILTYFTAYYMSTKYNIDDKLSSYPCLHKLFKYYMGMSLTFVIIEIIFCLVCLIIILISSLMLLGIPIIMHN